jgi:cyclopropane fatty-acyl-phospholipid synthase-like methyltransferase
MAGRGETEGMNPNKALWEKGDFTRIASSMRPSGEALVAKIGITKGLKVLDLGSGDGTTALPAARLGADVLGVDIASNLVAAGNARAKEAGLQNLRFQEGDACGLTDLKDAGFDLVVTVFGAMFAPRPNRTAARPTSTVSWTRCSTRRTRAGTRPRPRSRRPTYV